MPFFTVVIPLYNKEHFISATLHSVLAQTFTDYEILIVDDCSIDGSLAIAENFTNNKISLVKHSVNLGLSAARNTGIKHASSHYIAFLDSDDLWKPFFLEKMHELIQTFPEAGLFGAAYEEVYDGISLEVAKNIDAETEKMSLISDFFMANAHQPIFCFSSVVVKRAVFDVAGFFNENITLGEDVDFNIRAGQHFKVAYYNQVSAGYVIFSQNQITTSSISGKTVTDFNSYEHLASNNKSLKYYLDANRYFLAMHYKMAGEKGQSKNLVSEIDLTNLTQRQILLLKAPVWVVKLARLIKFMLMQKGIRLTTFKR